ncbi:MAG: hypothetical protein VXW65_12855 [Pseudomonadota bacterium]|nr:hypothetical protein [Pseudomonadota bacterium]
MLLSVTLFITAFAALFSLFLNGLSWLYVAIAVGGFLLAAWIWPSRRKSDRRGKDYSFLDWLELLIELPAELLLLPFRFIVSIGRLFDGI